MTIVDQGRISLFVHVSRIIAYVVKLPDMIRRLQAADFFRELRRIAGIDGP